MKIPEELLAGNLNDRRVRRSVCKINRSPNALSHEHENRQYHGRGDQKKGFGSRIVMPVRRPFSRILAVTRDKVAQSSLNKNESNTADDQHGHEEAVDPLAVLGRQRREPIRLRNK